MVVKLSFLTIKEEHKFEIVENGAEEAIWT
jgi:hypothetical protein